MNTSELDISEGSLYHAFGYVNPAIIEDKSVLVKLAEQVASKCNDAQTFRYRLALKFLNYQP